MSFYYYEQTWLDLKEFIKKDALVILPVGTTEEHGPHLPVEADTMIGEGFGRVIGKELARRNEIPFLVMRTVVYGYSMGCVQDFPGTISVRPNIVEEYVYDIVDSLCRMGFTKVVILGCHGNHDGILRNVMRRIVDKYGVYIGVVSPLGMSDYNKLKRIPTAISTPARARPRLSGRFSRTP
jgi:creatinine amidohydrolase